MPKQQTEDQFQPVLSVIDSRYLRTHLQDFKDEQLSALIFGLRQLRYSTPDLLRTLHADLQRRMSSNLYPDLLAKTGQYLVHMHRGHREPVESFLLSQEREVSRFSNRNFTEFFYSLFQMSLLAGSPNMLDVFQNSLVARLHAGQSDLNATNLGYLAEIASQTCPNICLSRFYRLAAQNSRVTDPHILGRLVTYGVYALLNPKTQRSQSEASPQLYQDTCVFYRVALRRAINQPLSFYELSAFFWNAATLGRVEPELEALVRQLGHRLQEGDRPSSPTYLLILNWSLMALGLVCQPLLNLMASDLILDHLKAFLSKNVRDRADAQGVIQIYLTLLMARYFQGLELVDPEIEALVKAAYVWNENACFIGSPTQADVLDTLRRVSSQFIESEHMTHSGLSIDILCREPS